MSFGLAPIRGERHCERSDCLDDKEPTYPAAFVTPGLVTDRSRKNPDFRLVRSRNSKAASGTSQLIQVARGSTHGAATPVTVANPPISLSTTAEHNKR